MSDLQFAPCDAMRLQRERDVFWIEADPASLSSQRFEAWPVGQKLALRYGPQDMHYANPVIMIARAHVEGRTLNVRHLRNRRAEQRGRLRPAGHRPHVRGARASRAG